MYRYGAILVAILVAAFGARLVWLAMAGRARWRGLEVSRGALGATGVAIVALALLYATLVWPRVALLR